MSKQLAWRIYAHMGGWMVYQGTIPIRKFLREDDARAYIANQQAEQNKWKKAAAA